MTSSPSQKKRPPRKGVTVPVYVLLIGFAVLVGAYLWISHEMNKPAPPPSWTDQEAGTTPIEDALDELRAAWSLSDLDAVLTLTMRDEDEDEDTESETKAGSTLLERRIRQNGWDGGLPALSDPQAQRTGAERYTVTWPLVDTAPVEGAPEDEVRKPIVTFWEWDGKRWLIANWQIALSDR